MTQSEYTREQRAALVVLGRMAEQANMHVAPSQLAQGFEEQGYPRDQLVHALNGLVAHKAARVRTFYGVEERSYELTPYGRDEYEAEKR